VQHAFTELAYDAALRALDKQEGVLEELRARTGVLLAASSLATSFLGRSALDNASALLVVVTLAAFATTIAASVYVLVPKKAFFFAVSGTAILEELYEFREDVDEVRRRLTYDLERFWDRNDDAIQKLFWSFRIAAVALVVDIVLLLAAVSDTVV
jgi:hypothetical protein